MTFHGTQRGAIVVGVDGSKSSRHALEWALRQAELTGANVIAIQAWLAPTDYATGDFLIPPEQWIANARASLESIVSHASSERPQVPIEQRVIEGHPATVLVEQARDAELLVVGSRGRGAFTSALLGSVSMHVIHRAPCPVVVIPGKT